MQMIPYSGLHIQPAEEIEGYDEQKDLIERGSRKICNIYTKYDGIVNGKVKHFTENKVVRAIPTEERGTLFTVFISADRLEFGLYKNGSIVQTMVHGHPPIRQQHIDRLCDRVENDIHGRLKYKDDPGIEKAWEDCFSKRNEEEFTKAVEGIRDGNSLAK